MDFRIECDSASVERSSRGIEVEMIDVDTDYFDDPDVAKNVSVVAFIESNDEEEIAEKLDTDVMLKELESRGYTVEQDE